MAYGPTPGDAVMFKFGRWMHPLEGSTDFNDRRSCSRGPFVILDIDFDVGYCRWSATAVGPHGAVVNINWNSAAECKTLSG